MCAKTKIAIVEDEAETREWIGKAIKVNPEFDLVGSWGSIAQTFLEYPKHQKIDVILVDLGLPDGSGIDLIREIHQRDKHIRFLVISVFGDERHVVNAIEAGASGYLLKDSCNKEIATAIEQLIDGGAPITSSVAIYLLKRFQSPVISAPADPGEVLLTEREHGVLQLIARGHTYAEIANSLNISINTVRAHIKNIFRKLSANSRSEAVFHAVEQGILKL